MQQAGVDLSVDPLTSSADRRAESAIGTIWSSSLCMINVGTSIFFRPSVKWVCENAFTPS